mgnify:FL=1
MLRYAVKELVKRKKKYALNILVISLVVVLLITLTSLNTAYKDASKLPFESIHSSIIVQKNGNVAENTTGALVSCSLAPIKKDLISNIKSLDGVSEVSYGLSLWVFDEDTFKRVLGVNWDDSLGRKIKSKIYVGSLPQSDEKIIVEKTFAQENNIILNQKIIISGEAFIVAGLSETSGKDIVSSDIYANLKPVQEMAYNSKNLQDTETFDRSDINIIFVDAKQTKVADVSEELDSLLNKQDSFSGKTPTGQKIGSYSIYTPESFENQISSIFNISDKIVLLLTIVILIGTALILFTSMAHAITERKKEFGIMKAVGFTNKDLKKQLTLEILIQVIVGFLIGILISLMVLFALSGLTVSVNIPWELNPYPHFLASNPSSVNTIQTYPLPIQFNPQQVILPMLSILIISFLTIHILLKNIGKLKPMEVLKYE